MQANPENIVHLSAMETKSLLKGYCNTGYQQAAVILSIKMNKPVMKLSGN